MAPNLTPIKIAKIGRNESCPCGSGKKYKHCCGVTGGSRLAETLDQILEPRVAPGKPGRPEGAGNYEWTPEMDKALRELLARYYRDGTAPPGGRRAFAKQVMARRLMELCPRESKPRKDSFRKAVERRIVFLGLPANRSKKAEPNPAECTKKAPKEVRSGAWSPHEISAVLGTIGGDLIDETLVERTNHSAKACYAKLYRLGYTINELRSGAFTVDELAEMLQVTPRRIRTWKEKRWLKTTRRRVTDKDLMAFIKKHHGLIAFDALDLCVRNFLIDLGYPAKEASTFKANVKAIMETVAGRKKRCDAQATGANDSRSEEGALKRALDKIARWNNLKQQRPKYYPWPSSLPLAPAETDECQNSSRSKIRIYIGSRIRVLMIKRSGRKRLARSVLSQLSACLLQPFAILRRTGTFRWFGALPKGSSNCVLISSPVLIGTCQCANHTRRERYSTKARQLRAAGLRCAEIGSRTPPRANTSDYSDFPNGHGIDRLSGAIP